MKRVEEDPGPWKAASFEGARAAQTREAARRLSPYERIRWCCEMSEAIRLRSNKAPGEPVGGACIRPCKAGRTRQN